MSDPLREKLKALVEEWRWNARNERIGWPEAAGLLYAADRLEDAILNSPEIPDGCAALLAESEPEPEPQDNAHQLAARLGYAQQRPGFDPGTGATVYQLVKHPDCEAKAKLPLGQEVITKRR